MSAIQPDLPEMQWDRGYMHERTQCNQLEKAFADLWEEQNKPRSYLNFGFGLLQDLFFSSRGKSVHEVTISERFVAATVVQWLGTNCGFSFLQRALERGGYSIVRTAELQEMRGAASAAYQRQAQERWEQRQREESERKQQEAEALRTGRLFDFQQ